MVNRSQIIRTVSVCLVLLFSSIQASAAIIYNVNRTAGGSTVSGFIETDGTLGVLTSANILDWSFTLSGSTNSGVIDKANQVQTNLGSGGNTTATSTQLLFDFDIPGSGYFLLQGPDGYWCLETSGCTGRGNGEHIYINSLGGSNGDNRSLSGNVVFAEVSAVPVPASIWLLGSGLIGLIGVARRR